MSSRLYGRATADDDDSGAKAEGVEVASVVSSATEALHRCCCHRGPATPAARQEKALARPPRRDADESDDAAQTDSMKRSFDRTTRTTRRAMRERMYDKGWGPRANVATCAAVRSCALSIGQSKAKETNGSDVDPRLSLTGLPETW